MKMTSKFLKSIKPLAVDNDDEFVKVDEELLAEDDISGDSDEDLHHSNLLKDISKLDEKKQKSLKWKATRFEANKDVNEFNISKNQKEQLAINDLIKDIKQTNGGLKKLKHWHLKHVMDVPLEKPVANKLKRKVNYNLVTKSLSKWEPIVEANRNATQIQFPLKQEVLTLKPATEAMKAFKPKTKLELEVSELLAKSENNLTDDKALTVAEEKILKAMSLEEARLRHKELQKMRALLSYQEVKLKRQSKIKSKRYHRILKREKLKKSLQEFEESQKSDPKVAIDKLQELDKLRALERASLKHKNTGKWAKHLKIRSKYDDNARIALTEQLQINQKLVQRRVELENDIDVNADDETGSDEDTDHEEDNNDDNKFEELPNDYNPWMRSGQKSKPKDEIKVEQQERDDRPINYETSGPNTDPIEESDDELPQLMVGFEPKKSEPIKQEKIESEKDVQIDPNDFISIKSHKIKSYFTDVVTELDSGAESAEESDDISDDEQKKLVSEAFADDDVISDFKKDKSDKIDGENPKDINLHLPGWGSWGGTGIRESKRKIRKFTIKANKKPRKDHKLGNVIISEKTDDIIDKYRVNTLPFPFKNCEEFDKSIRQPIGRTWNPETAFRELTEPKIVTKMGTIIDPIDADALVNNEVKRRTIIPRIKRNKPKVDNKSKTNTK